MPISQHESAWSAGSDWYLRHSVRTRHQWAICIKLSFGAGLVLRSHLLFHEQDAERRRWRSRELGNA
jgi:hypothetical protein